MPGHIRKAIRENGCVAQAVVRTVRAEDVQCSGVGLEADYAACRTDCAGKVKCDEARLCSHINANIAWANHPGYNTDEMSLVGAKIELAVHPVMGIDPHVESPGHELPLGHSAERDRAQDTITPASRSGDRAQNRQTGSQEVSHQSSNSQP